MIKAKKSLGQNFLVDKNILEKIVTTADIFDKTILEIGPGRGALTELLVSKGDLIAVEKDKWLSVVLKQKFKGSAEIIEGGILNCEIAIHCGNSQKLLDK